MKATSSALLENEHISREDFSENDKLSYLTMNQYKGEISELSRLDETQIKSRILEKFNGEVKSPEYVLSLKNILYLKQLFFIENIESSTKTLDLELLREIKLCELVDLTCLDPTQPKIEINYSKIDEVVTEKNTELEKWREYNINATLSSLTGISENNISFISELSEYTSFISELEPAFNYVSRGQKDCSFKLDPSLHRSHDGEFEVHIDNYESAFRQKVVYYDKDIKSRSIEELRAEGQHFGLPTDYLDFTEAHLISLLFAIEDFNYTQQHSIVFFIDALSYNTEAIAMSEKLLDYSNSTTVEYVKKHASKSYFIKLGNSNERIHFQKGCFLKVSHLEDKTTFNKRLSKFGKAVVVNKDFKKEILMELFNLGITFENIYPDKDNVVKSIRFHYEQMIKGGK